jgi:hypothetical protein
MGIMLISAVERSGKRMRGARRGALFVSAVRLQARPVRLAAVAQISDADAVPTFGNFDQRIIAANGFLADAIVQRGYRNRHIGGIRKSMD